MADRRVRKTGKDENGNITSLCNDGQAWSPRKAADAIHDIENKIHRYFVDEAGYETTVEVITRQDGTKFLRTNADPESKNNLAKLPDC